MLTFDVAGEAVVIDPEVVIVAGYTGRDGAAVQRHIEELADEGVPAPASVPTYLALPPAAVAQADGITTIHAETSGEAEIALVVDGGRRFVTLASDHTDRRAETFDMAIAKFACPKLLASRAWPYEAVAAHWDQLCLRSWVDDGSGRTLYQEGLAAALLAPEALIRGIPFQDRPGSYVILLGTLPVIGGIRPSSMFWAELAAPNGLSPLTLEYRVDVLDALLSAAP